MAAKKPSPGKRRKRKKFKLSLKSSKLKKTDSYSDSVGWSQDVGRTVEAAPVPKGPEIIKHQCSLRGAIMKVPKPKKARYTILCPHCNHEDSFM